MPEYTISNVQGGSESCTCFMQLTAAATLAASSDGEGSVGSSLGWVVGLSIWMRSYRWLLDQRLANSRSRRRAQVKSTPPPGISAPSGSPITALLMPSTTSSSVLQPMLKEAIWPKFFSGAPWSMMAPTFPGPPKAAASRDPFFGALDKRLNIVSLDVATLPHSGPFSHFFFTRSRHARLSSMLS